MLSNQGNKPPQVESGREEVYVTPPVKYQGDSGWYFTGFVQDSVPVDMLLDTGASHSLLQSSVYDELPSHLRPPLESTPFCRLSGFTGEVAEIRGRVNLKFGTIKRSWNVNFIVARKIRNNILGADFMADHGLRMDFAQGLIWCNQTYSPALKEIDDSVSAVVKNSQDVPPRAESMIEAYVDCYPPESVVMVEGTMEDLEKGFVVANTVVTLGEGGKCNVRVMNPGKYPLTIQPCKMGRISLASQVQIAYPLP